VSLDRSVADLRDFTFTAWVKPLGVDLRASDASASAATWTNNGSLGSFARTGSATNLRVANVASTGVPGVSFDGSAFYTGSNSVADLDGASDRSIEVWAYNPALADEETMVSWGHRGFVDQDMAFNFGSNASFGAATHWGDDVGWGATLPSANAWHHLVYTYDGAKAVKLYIDGALAKSATLSGTLNTFVSEPINIGCQRESNGVQSLFFSGTINSVRVHGGVLSAAQVAANYSLGPDGAAANVAPTLATVADQTMGYGATLPVSLTVGDSDTALVSLTVSASAANGALVPAGGITFSSSGATRTMSISPAAQSGTTAITVTVSDGSATASRTFNLTVLTAQETWRQQYFGTTANTGNAADSADPDGDGLTNMQEFGAGTNPLDAASALRISQVQASGTNMIVSFPSASGKTYRVDRSDMPQNGPWVAVQDNIAGTGGTMQITDANAAAQTRRFYRVVVY